MTRDYFTPDFDRSLRVTRTTSPLSLSETLYIMLVIAGALSLRTLLVQIGLDNLTATLVAIAIIFVGACLATWFQNSTLQVTQTPRSIEVRVVGDSLKS